MFGNGFHKDFLYRFPRDQGKADWPLVPQILLLSVLEQRSDLYILAVFRNLPQSTQALKINSVGSGDDMNQLFSTGGCNPSGDMNLGMTYLFK